MSEIYRQYDITDELEDEYTKHIDHMTGEKLNSKSEIAWELAHRDVLLG